MVWKCEIIVISQDVKALYPSINWDEIVRIFGKILEETSVTFGDVDYRGLGKGLAIHLSQEEIAKNNLTSIIQRRL